MKIISTNRVRPEFVVEYFRVNQSLSKITRFDERRTVVSSSIDVRGSFSLFLGDEKKREEKVSS